MIRALSSVCALSVAASLAGAPAWAQEAIPTAANAPSAGAPAPPPAAVPPLTLNDRRQFDDSGPPLVGPCGAVGDIVDGVPQKPDKNPHGSVWAGVGTAGYREVGGHVCVPIGDKAAVDIAVDSTRINGWAGWRGW